MARESLWRNITENSRLTQIADALGFGGRKSEGCATDNMTPLKAESCKIDMDPTEFGDVDRLETIPKWRKRDPSRSVNILAA